MKVTKTVEWALEHYPETRNSDKKLLLKIWREFGLHLSHQQESIFLDCPAPETIRRVRQKIQESGKYPATKRVKTQRNLKSMEMQQNTPKASPARIEELTNGQPVPLPWGQ